MTQQQQVDEELVMAIKQNLDTMKQQDVSLMIRQFVPKNHGAFHRAFHCTTNECDLKWILAIELSQKIDLANMPKRTRSNEYDSDSASDDDSADYIQQQRLYAKDAEHEMVLLEEIVRQQRRDERDQSILLSMLSEITNITNVQHPKSKTTVLMLAADSGFAELLVQLLNKGADVNFQDRGGDTALILASHQGNAEIVRLLSSRAETNVNVQQVAGNTALMIASRKGHAEIVEILLARKDIDVNVKDKNGDTALILTSFEGKAEIVQILLAAEGIDIDIKNDDGNTALMMASISGNANIVQMLINKEANINIQNKDGNAALIFATENPDTSIMQILLAEDGINVNIKNNNGYTALMLAALNPDANVVRILLAVEGIDVDIKSNNGDSALVIASGSGNANIVQMLLEHKADVNIRDNDENTALIIASRKKEVSIIQMLLDAKANVNAKNNDGDTALIYASNEGVQDIVERLLAVEGVDVNVKNIDGNTALLLAVDKSHGNFIRMLLDAGADVNVKNNNGRTALMIAILDGNSGIAELLLIPRYEANVDIQDNDGNTALLHATINTQENRDLLIRLLLIYDANVNIQNKKGETALICAIRKGSTDIIDELIEKGADKFKTDNNGMNMFHTLFTIDEEDDHDTSFEDLNLYIFVLLTNLIGSEQQHANDGDIFGNTILHYAYKKRWISDDIRIQLVETYKCNPNVTNKFGQRPEQMQQQRPLCTLDVDRMNPMYTLDRYNLWLNQNNWILDYEMKIKGEDGIDMGGVTRDVIAQIINALWDENTTTVNIKSYSSFETSMVRRTANTQVGKIRQRRMGWMMAYLIAKAKFDTRSALVWNVNLDVNVIDWLDPANNYINEDMNELLKMNMCPQMTQKWNNVSTDHEIPVEFVKDIISIYNGDKENTKNILNYLTADKLTETCDQPSEVFEWIDKLDNNLLKNVLINEVIQNCLKGVMWIGDDDECNAAPQCKEFQQKLLDEIGCPADERGFVCVENFKDRVSGRLVHEKDAIRNLMKLYYKLLYRDLQPFIQGFRGYNQRYGFLTRDDLMKYLKNDAYDTADKLREAIIAKVTVQDGATIESFRGAIEDFDLKQLRKLLGFWTGQESLNNKPLVIRADAYLNRNPENLPKSHTCFETLDIPTRFAGNVELYRKKLLQAMYEGAGFGLA